MSIKFKKIYSLFAIIALQSIIFISCQDNAKYSSINTVNDLDATNNSDTDNHEDFDSTLPLVCDNSTFRYVLLTGDPFELEEPGSAVKGIYLKKKTSGETLWVSRAIAPSMESFQTKIKGPPNLDAMCDNNFDYSIQGATIDSDFIYYSFGPQDNPTPMESGDRVGVIIVNKSECSNFEDKTYSLSITTCPGDIGAVIVSEEREDQERSVGF